MKVRLAYLCNETKTYFVSHYIIIGLMCDSLADLELNEFILCLKYMSK